ncbi:hypothetical protein GF406_12045 [candidate division KSB1 bacterium]|nr:hypothetical protein [candidate division KSB1 bacterium]
MAETIKIKINGNEIEGEKEFLKQIIHDLPNIPKSCNTEQKYNAYTQSNEISNAKYEKSRGEAPSTFEIFDFIKTQPNFEHSTSSIARYFYGSELDSINHRSAYNRLLKRIKKARKKILEEKPNSKWDSERDSKRAERFRLVNA